MNRTKGPWGASATPSSSLSSTRRISGPDGEDIATIHCMAGEMDQEEALANARLIKTVPELLETLEGLHKALSRMIDKHEPDSKEAEWLQHSHEAICNAKGRKP